MLPVRIGGDEPDRDWLETLIDAVGLGDRRKHLPSELSGGQQQRVAVARALITRPAVVFADEPTGNLDSDAGRDVLELLRRAVDDFGQTIVMVTHDPAAAAIADRVLFLADGRIVDTARAPDAGRDPRPPEGARAMTALALRGLGAAQAALGADGDRGAARRGDDRRHLRPDGPDPRGFNDIKQSAYAGRRRRDRAEDGVLERVQLGAADRRARWSRGRAGPRRRAGRGRAHRAPARSSSTARPSTAARRRSSSRLASRSARCGTSRGACRRPPARSPSTASSPTDKGLRARRPRRHRHADAASQPARLVGIFDFGTSPTIGGATSSSRPLADVQALVRARGRGHHDLVAADDGRHARAARPALQPRSPRSLEVRTGAAGRRRQRGRDQRQIGGFLTPALLAFAGAALLVGAFIIFNTFSITVAERTASSRCCARSARPAARSSRPSTSRRC